MYASEFGRTDIAEMLLIYGADYKLKDKKGCTAYIYSCLDLHTDITIMINKTTGRFNILDKKKN